MRDSNPAPEKLSFVEASHLLHLKASEFEKGSLDTSLVMRRSNMAAIQGQASRKRPRQHDAVRALADAGNHLFETLRTWRRRMRDRARLAELDERTLRDIGLTRADAAFLANKPFWRE